MKARTAIVRTAHRVRLSAFGLGLMTVLAAVALSACTSSPGTSTPSSSVSVLSPSASGSVSPSTSASASASTSASASGSPSGTPSYTPSPTPSYSPSPSPSYSPYPTAAPVTGGGGTAGFEDGGLALLGGVAIVAGLGSIGYRRWITRRR
jgi:hypothetical protein